LLHERDGSDRLLKAEALRELGSFREAEVLLARPFPKKLRDAAAIVRKLTGERDTAVHELKP
jgi:hypothetical protein